ncbi:MAG TPA: hypothetical protein VKK61_08315, partial [Tepidisphaeraceae bacterium]|nr:hypothetical protein [Tepidisphaeraceae bacterium]
MHVGPSHRRLKIAFIHQPWSIVVPPVNAADSVALLTDELARRVCKSCDVISYSRLGKMQPEVERFQNVEYRRASVSIDRWLKLGMQNIDRLGWRDPLRPFFTSDLCYRQFITEVMNDLAGQNCDLVHIQNFTQFAPLIRKRFPKMKIVV